LFEGDSSRLYQKLVKGDESVVSIQGGVDERRGPSAWYIFALPKPGEEVGVIRDQIFAEIKDLATKGPSAEEMEKLRNSLSNDAVRGRQSSMYRAQRISEYALYDNDPQLFDSELSIYLSITAEEIRSAVSEFLDVDNRVVLDIVPAGSEEEFEVGEPAASPLPPGEPMQPTSPAPQVPSRPPVKPTVGTAPAAVLGEADSATVELEQPTDSPKPAKRVSGPLHP
jgi:hypothetical protein